MEKMGSALNFHLSCLFGEYLCGNKFCIYGGWERMVFLLRLIFNLQILFLCICSSYVLEERTQSLDSRKSWWLPDSILQKRKISEVGFNLMKSHCNLVLSRYLKCHSVKLRLCIELVLCSIYFRNLKYVLQLQYSQNQNLLCIMLIESSFVTQLLSVFWPLIENWMWTFSVCRWFICESTQYLWFKTWVS